MGPGPSMVHPSTLRAMAAPSLGHLDPRFLAIMDETVGMLRRVFATANPITLPLSGTGTAGMEAALANAVEPEDRVIVVVNGYFGDRMVEMARRLGGEVDVVEVPWGQAVDPKQVEEVAGRGRAPRVLAMVHAETSTGVLQPIEPLAALARQYDALLVVDAVTSLGGVPVEVDRAGVDLCYSGSQKCLSAPPGLAPFTASPRAMRRLEARKRDVFSWYLDLRLVAAYWGQQRVYHHTAPVHMVYALHRALERVLEEGLEARWQRHRRVARALWAGLEALGLQLAVTDPALRIASLTTVRVPEGVDDAGVRRTLLEEFGIEIGGGLGPWKGQVWRIGTMGESAALRHVSRLVAALGELLRRQGWRNDVTGALAAVTEAARRDQTRAAGDSSPGLP
ncbi:MAG: alanine--glyoxylate aminotransferase family protein [Limnochordaceae bacterium]|nr:alanine--glyoxylate aminotransferase family protein [Limnochordaceae bacterium]